MKINFIVTAESNMIQVTQKFAKESQVNKFCRHLKRLHDNMLRHHGFDKKIKISDLSTTARYNHRQRWHVSERQKQKRVLMAANEAAIEKVGKLKIIINRANV